MSEQAERIRELKKKLQAPQELKASLNMLFPYFCPLTREEFERHVDDKEITDILSKFQIDDPYEICFTGRFSCLRHLWPSGIVGRAEKPFTDSSRTLHSGLCG
ncbi:hypothetical protein B5F07_19580 [Lachnoclostridium sp. An169]|nr:hypothetical protein B5F07_19580 [Lachnoclostridium sp. An169]